MSLVRSRFARRAAVVVSAALLLGTPLLATGCGGGDGPKRAKITPGEMPEGETWRGVYFHPVYGHLHIEEEDNNIHGKWQRTDHSHWGELSGVANGNVLRYTWKEHKVGMVGASATTQGKGYFVYKMNSDGIGELHGEFGMGKSDNGSDWKCVKQVRVEPDLKSVGGEGEGVTPGQL